MDFWTRKMSWLSPHFRRERAIRIFRKTVEKQTHEQHVCNINIAFYKTLPQDVVSYIISFIPQTVVSCVDMRRAVTLYKRNYIVDF